MKPKRSTLTRRAALRAALAAGTLALPATALADTEADLAGAQARLAEAQAELDAIAQDYEDLCTQQSQTLDDIDAAQKDIDRVQRRIERLQKQLLTKQEELSGSVSEEYKDGSRGVVDLLLRSTSVEGLISNLYYYQKITTQQAELIQDVKDARERYEDERLELEAHEAELQELSDTQQAQLEDMRAKQYEAQQLIEGLDQEVQELVAKRDAELLAAQQEAERARKEREEAERKAAEQAAAAEAAAEKTDAVDDVTDEVEETASTTAVPSVGSAAAVVASCQSTPSPGLGLCAGWCSNVMINAGYGFVAGNANDMYANFCHSSDRADIRPGMAVAVSTHPHTSAGRIYGHIGMYIGNGTMMDNIGYIRTISLDEWCSFYGVTVPARWGWLNNIVLE